MQGLSVFRRLVSLAATARGICMLLPSRDHVVHRGSVLPHPDLRINGPDQQDNQFYLESAIKEAKRVLGKLGCKEQDHLVDLGCGQGRLAIGLIHERSNVRYLGLDVSETCISWCKAHIEQRYPAFRFRHIDVVNARYNPSGHALARDFRLPVADGAADIVYIWGVATNMEPDHLAAYANETSRMLRRGGRAFLTAYVEDKVPEVSINPENYTRFACNGPLHVVRYERQYFLDVFQRAGLRLRDFVYHGSHGAEDCQSEVYFEK